MCCILKVCQALGTALGINIISLNPRSKHCGLGITDVWLQREEMEQAQRGQGTCPKAYSSHWQDAVLNLKHLCPAQCQ